MGKFCPCSVILWTVCSCGTPALVGLYFPFGTSLTDEGPRTPLLQASREVRVAALGKIDSLVNALAEKAQEIVESIKTAQRTIEKL